MLEQSKAKAEAKIIGKTKHELIHEHMIEPKI